MSANAQVTRTIDTVHTVQGQCISRVRVGVDRWIGRPKLHRDGSGAFSRDHNRPHVRHRNHVNSVGPSGGPSRLLKKLPQKGQRLLVTDTIRVDVVSGLVAV